MKTVSRRVTVALCVLLAGASITSGETQARVVVGFGFGFPAYGWPWYAPPPVYYPPPPVYYAPPPPVWYVQPPIAQTPIAPPSIGAGQSCNAGAYMCPMDRPAVPGSSCYCLGNGGQRVWGRAG